MVLEALAPLFAPGRIGPATIKNRIVMPPMTTRLADRDGFASEDSIAYYSARARGGVGLVTVEMASPERAGRHRFNELGIYDDRFLPGLTRIAAAIHAEGAQASIQLGHAGGHTRRDICGETPVAPSAIPHPVFELTFETVVPEALSEARIESIVAAYAAAARRARAAGFDCVEIHAAHGYLISQFHTPYENRRSDRYGGSLENRARFGLEILRAVKAAVPELGVSYRLSVDDFFPEGMPYVEGRQIALWAAEAGADALHIAAGHYRSLPSAARQIPPMALPEATFLEYAADIKREVAVAVIAVGRLGDPAVAAAALASGKADFIALGRSLIADPQWVEKTARGEPRRACLACNSCINEMRGGARVGCVVNAVAGNERRYATPARVQGEAIAVIGAGPAGLTYALLAAPQNRVTVFERDARAGGALRLAGRAPLYQEVEAVPAALDGYIDALVAAAERAGVVLRYGVDVAADPAVLEGHERIIIATGAAYRYGLGAIVPRLLRSRLVRAPLVRQLLVSARLRDWFYHRARRPTGAQLRERIGTFPHVEVIGDAAVAGKTKAAVASAFEAAHFS